MTTRIYIRARDPDNGVRVVRELLQNGVDPTRIEVIGRHPPAGLPVAARRWHPPAAWLLAPALIGAVVAPAMGAALFGGLDAFLTLVLALLGGAVGAGWQLSRGPRERDPLAVQAPALRRGDLIIVVDVEASKLASMEAEIAARHPEVLLLGPDPGGSPPFP